MACKVAVVTGSNKGIGLELVKELCERFNGVVYLTSRDLQRGQNAVQELKNRGLRPFYHQLDVTDKKSIKKFHDYLRSKYGGIDILINNAGVYFDDQSQESPIVQAEETLRINYHGLALVCESLFPILRPHARVINVTSALGHPSWIPNEIIRQKFTVDNLTELKLNRIVNDFIKSVKRGTNEEEGWGSSYVISKVAVSALTFIHSKMYNQTGISINCYHPGYVGTDLNKNEGPMTVQQGAKTGLYLALEARSNLTGKYLWYDNSIVDWYGPLPSNLFEGTPSSAKNLAIPIEDKALLLDEGIKLYSHGLEAIPIENRAQPILDLNAITIGDPTTSISDFHATD